jgi:hypothetical protein
VAGACGIVADTFGEWMENKEEAACMDACRYLSFFASVSFCLCLDLSISDSLSRSLSLSLSLYVCSFLLSQSYGRSDCGEGHAIIVNLPRSRTWATSLHRYIRTHTRAHTHTHANITLQHYCKYICYNVNCYYDANCSYVYGFFSSTNAPVDFSRDYWLQKSCHKQGACLPSRPRGGWGRARSEDVVVWELDVVGVRKCRLVAGDVRHLQSESSRFLQIFRGDDNGGGSPAGVGGSIFGGEGRGGERGDIIKVKAVRVELDKVECASNVSLNHGLTYVLPSLRLLENVCRVVGAELIAFVVGMTRKGGMGGKWHRWVATRVYRTFPLHGYGEGEGGWVGGWGGSRGCGVPLSSREQCAQILWDALRASSDILPDEVFEEALSLIQDSVLQPSSSQGTATTACSATTTFALTKTDTDSDTDAGTRRQGGSGGELHSLHLLNQPAGASQQQVDDDGDGEEEEEKENEEEEEAAIESLEAALGALTLAGKFSQKLIAFLRSSETAVRQITIRLTINVKQ